MMNYGYARVSTGGQDLAAQINELTAAGVGQVVTESASAAAGRRRPQLATLVARLQPGDVLTVTRLNRLARSSRDALNVLATVTGRGAHFRSLREPWADTTTPYGRLMTTILAGLAEFDREMILERTQEGRQAAKARGVRMGRKPSLSGAQLRYILDSRDAEPRVPLKVMAQVTGVSVATVKRALRAAELGQAFHTAPPAQLDIEDVTGR
jgi:DNA invertase Pin-like site-specific DNA recombinase